MNLLYTSHAMWLIVASVILLLSMIGVIVITIGEREVTSYWRIFTATIPNLKDNKNIMHAELLTLFTPLSFNDLNNHSEINTWCLILLFGIFLLSNTERTELTFNKLSESILYTNPNSNTTDYSSFPSQTNNGAGNIPNNQDNLNATRLLEKINRANRVRKWFNKVHSRVQDENPNKCKIVDLWTERLIRRDNRISGMVDEFVNNYSRNVGTKELVNRTIVDKELRERIIDTIIDTVNDLN